MSAFTDPDIAVAYARARWEEGELRIQRCAPGSRKRDLLELVVDGIQSELEKRVGQVFTSSALIVLQDASEEWCTRIAHELAPDDPWAWELDTVQNAAFYRYARRASDYQVVPG